MGWEMEVGWEMDVGWMAVSMEGRPNLRWCALRRRTISELFRCCRYARVQSQGVQSHFLLLRPLLAFPSPSMASLAANSNSASGFSPSSLPLEVKRQPDVAASWGVFATDTIPAGRNSRLVGKLAGVRLHVRVARRVRRSTADVRAVQDASLGDGAVRDGQGSRRSRNGAVATASGASCLFAR
jgi:hypothetical protein